MPLVVDDKSKDKDIDDATTNIEIKKKSLLDNWTWLTEAQRREKKEQLKMMEFNREYLINKKIGKTVERKPSLYDPIPQTELEKRKLLELIDSV